MLVRLMIGNIRLSLLSLPGVAPVQRGTFAKPTNGSNAPAARQVLGPREQSRADTAKEIAMATVFGTNGVDWIDASDGVTNGADHVYGLDGDDTLFGLGGDDLLWGGKGADHLHGDKGTDTASYKGSLEGVHVDLFGGFGLYGDAEGDTLDSIENLIGSKHDDTLVGNEKDNVL